MNPGVSARRMFEKSVFRLQFALILPICISVYVINVFNTGRETKSCSAYGVFITTWKKIKVIVALCGKTQDISRTVLCDTVNLSVTVNIIMLYTPPAACLH